MATAPTQADRIRQLLDEAHTCPPWRRAAATDKLLRALRDPRWYIAGWNYRPGLPHLKLRLVK